MKNLAVISSLLLSGCASSMSWQAETYYPTKQDIQAENFIKLVDFMHDNKHITKPTKRIVDTMKYYIAQAGMVRECNQICYLRYGDKKILVSLENITIITPHREIKVIDPEDAIRYIY